MKMLLFSLMMSLALVCVSTLPLSFDMEYITMKRPGLYVFSAYGPHPSARTGKSRDCLDDNEDVPCIEKSEEKTISLSAPSEHHQLSNLAMIRQADSSHTISDDKEEIEGSGCESTDCLQDLIPNQDMNRDEDQEQIQEFDQKADTKSDSLSDAKDLYDDENDELTKAVQNHIEVKDFEDIEEDDDEASEPDNDD